MEYFLWQKYPNVLTELKVRQFSDFFSIKQITNKEIASGGLENEICWSKQYAWGRKLGKSTKKMANIGRINFVALLCWVNSNIL